MGDLLRVSEVFGPTFQGEGPHQGRRAFFLRMSGCNLDCAWCDTPYTWDWTGKNGVAYDREAETQTVSVNYVRDRLAELGFRPTDRLVISGGEPMLQQRALQPLVDGLKDVEIETNGTIMPRAMFAPWVRLFVVSPKLESSGVDARRSKPKVIRELLRWPSVYKFVVCSPADLVEVENFVAEHSVPRDHVWIMPEGKTRAEIEDKMQWTFEESARYGFNWTPRLHILTYDQKRAV